MTTAIAVFGAIVAILLIILLHEIGHFLVAKWAGIKVLRFSVGFGKPLLRHTSKSGTEYVLAALPLGGFVKMLGEEPGEVSAQEAASAYSSKPWWVRAAVVLAGPATNFILAIIAFWAVFLLGIVHVKPVIGSVEPHSILAQAGATAGDTIVAIDGKPTRNWQQVMMALINHLGNAQPMELVAQNHQQAPRLLTLLTKDWRVDAKNPDFFASLGMQPYEPPIQALVAKVLPKSPAFGYLQPRDQIMAINHTVVSNWQAASQVIAALPNQSATFLVQRDGQLKKITFTIGSKLTGSHPQGYLGIWVATNPIWPSDQLIHEHFTVLSAWWPALKQTATFIKFNANILGKMVLGKVSIQSLGGPITVFKAAGQASNAGWQSYLGFIGFISLTVGFINLIPIPGLDGGHLLFQIVEAIRRRPLSERVQAWGIGVGMTFLAFLMIQATINDLMRLLG